MIPSRLFLERHQLVIYLLFIASGLGFGLAFSGLANLFEALLWPVLAWLLFSAFSQVPIAHLSIALRDRRFLAAAAVGNFAIIPFLVWLLMLIAPDDEAIRLGILLVLLLPCTDWFITFAQLGGGDVKRAIAFSPVSLLLQILLLPLYLWLFLGGDFTASLVQKQMVVAFGLLIALPLLAAWGLEKWVDRAPQDRLRLIDALAWLPVPLLALTVFMIAAAQVSVVISGGWVLLNLAGLFTLFLVGAALLAWAMTRLLGLKSASGRTLAFSFGTRNSFVVLPLALTLPSGFEMAVVVIVFQSLIELLGMVFYLWWVPKLFFVKEQK